MHAAIGYARSRQGDIAFAVTDCSTTRVVLLTRSCGRVSLAVLSMYDGSLPYGKATLRGCSSDCSEDSRRRAAPIFTTDGFEPQRRAKSIGAPGFEPGTLPTQTVRATRLRHAPSTPPSLVPFIANRSIQA